MPLRTALTEMLGIEHPIIQGGMQYVGYAEMASAVSNAGGLGILTGLTQPDPEALRAAAEIRRCRTMTDSSCRAVIVFRRSPTCRSSHKMLQRYIVEGQDYDGYARVLAEEKAGLKVLHKSATMRHALKAQEAGVDLIEIVGYEGSIAGGQKGDEVGAWVLLAKVGGISSRVCQRPMSSGRVGARVRRVREFSDTPLEATSTLKVPVIAAGAAGFPPREPIHPFIFGAEARGASSQQPWPWAQGARDFEGEAHGITMATRFLCTVEAGPCPKDTCGAQRMPCLLSRQTTIVLGSLSNATRVFKNEVAQQIRDIEGKGDVDFSQVMPLASGQRTKKMPLGQFIAVACFVRELGHSNNMWQQSGDTSDAMWSCGQSLGLISRAPSDIPTCQELVRRIVQEAEERLQSSARMMSKLWLLEQSQLQLGFSGDASGALESAVKAKAAVKAKKEPLRSRICRCLRACCRRFTRCPKCRCCVKLFPCFYCCAPDHMLDRDFLIEQLTTASGGKAPSQNLVEETMAADGDRMAAHKQKWPPAWHIQIRSRKGNACVSDRLADSAGLQLLLLLLLAWCAWATVIIGGATGRVCFPGQLFAISPWQQLCDDCGWSKRATAMDDGLAHPRASENWDAAVKERMAPRPKATGRTAPEAASRSSSAVRGAAASHLGTSPVDGPWGKMARLTVWCWSLLRGLTKSKLQIAGSVVILPSCLFHIGNTQREQDLLNLPPPSCSSNPGSANLFQLRTKGAVGGALARTANQPVPRANQPAVEGPK
ncbi:unnamed protein product [Effrenium voratum]|uniref:Nitronate monooxygenase domain-containing protein n=1 Tax=Effrenium voratum TaxID=2562239 RepID=A0AA36N3I1_9DINO|nr:unnamed protein product [Effrenium voratum]